MRSPVQTIVTWAPAVVELVRQDPLDLLGLLREQLGGQRAGIVVGTTEGGYVTQDGRHRLIIAKPKHPPDDTGFSRALLTRLDTIAAGRRLPRGSAAPAGDDADEARPPLEVKYAAGHRIALETAALVRHESIMNGVSSLVMILPLLFLVFRSLWLLLCSAIPSPASLVVVSVLVPPALLVGGCRR